MTVQELMELLEGMDPDAEVRMAIQPSWPFEHDVEDAVEVYVSEDSEPVVYLAEGTQLGYLPGDAAEGLGW